MVIAGLFLLLFSNHNMVSGEFVMVSYDAVELYPFNTM